MDHTLCDIHMHLAPGVDDGAAGMEDSLRMILAAREQGIRQIFATPHSFAFDRDPRAVQRAFAALQETAARFFPDVALFPGCEVLCDPYSMDSTLEALASGKYPSLNGTKCVLTEFSPWSTAEAARQCLDSLRNAGWIPVIAHVERYPFLQGKWNTLYYFRELGCLFQINAYSLAEEQDPAIQGFAREMVSRKLADFLGTDAHRPNHRPPRAESAVRWLLENCDETYTRRLLRENAGQLLTAK